MKLNTKQYDHLFKGKPMKHTLLKKKRKISSVSRIKLGGFGSRAGLSSTMKMKEIPENKKQEALAELKEDDEMSQHNTSQASGESAVSRT